MYSSHNTLYIALFFSLFLVLVLLLYVLTNIFYADILLFVVHCFTVRGIHLSYICYNIHNTLIHTIYMLQNIFFNVLSLSMSGYMTLSLY